ncbi:hypothetical protein AVEN_65034-1 [Araneus ventricosus]|uniref:Uncharacterized protein n=1 Tax=Araneus ventricosus TaxID=182803 RepID=A0A4Y2TP43_ARAVE|nr:hypothetical protein AVEN_65034-1 [Araneus ventricosus]
MLLRNLLSDDVCVGLSLSLSLNLVGLAAEKVEIRFHERVYSGTPGWVGRRYFFRPLTTSAILVPVFPTGWDLARSKKGLLFLASSVPGVNAVR